MKNKKPKLRTKFYFRQDWGTYDSDTLVFVGMSDKEICKVLKRYGKNGEKMAEQIARHGEMDGIKGYVEINGTRSIMSLRKFEDCWEAYETLVHEIHHLIFGVLGCGRGLQNETEAQAYQMEYLFREMRRKLIKYSRCQK